MERLADAFGTAKTVARAAYEQQVKYPAAALAYYAFVSFVPFLMLVFAVVGEQFAARVYGMTPRFLTLEAQRLVYDAMTTASGRTGAGLLAVGVLAWSGANIVVGFLTVVERVEDASRRSLSTQIRDAAVILGCFTLAIVSIISTATLFAFLPDPLVFDIAEFLTLFVALTVVFLPLYYVPSRRVTGPTAAFPGAVTAAFGWTVVHTGVLFYAANATQYAVYGVLSGIVIILTSLYVAASILLSGIIVNATLVGETDSPGGPGDSVR